MDLVDVDVEREPRDHFVEVTVFDAQASELFQFAEQLVVDEVRILGCVAALPPAVFIVGFRQSKARRDRFQTGR